MRDAMKDVATSQGMQEGLAGARRSAAARPPWRTIYSRSLLDVGASSESSRELCPERLYAAPSIRGLTAGRAGGSVGQHIAQLEGHPGASTRAAGWWLFTGETVREGATAGTRMLLAARRVSNVRSVPPWPAARGVSTFSTLHTAARGGGGTSTDRKLLKKLIESGCSEGDPRSGQCRFISHFRVRSTSWTPPTAPTVME